MSAETPSAEPTDRTPPSDRATVPAAARVTVGSVWREQYQINKLLFEADSRWYAATRQGDQQEVWLRVSSRATAAIRNQLWTILRSLDSPHIQRPLEAHDGEERVEIWSAPAATTARRWRVDRDELNPEEIREFVRQISHALGQLHAKGLGHFSLRTDNIYVDIDAEAPVYCLGGFDTVQRIEQADLIPIPVDPLSAPPEAAGLFKHSPGPLLQAWDWWSLGRVVQELIIGHHVVTHAPDELLTDPPRSRTQMAEALLFEREIGNYRAGAIEWMPRLDPDPGLLLRGLLASSREGRWGAVEIQSWLNGEKPKEHYNQSRQQRFFRLEDRGYPPAEAAQILRGPNYTDQIVSHIFGFDKPGQFAHFLYETRNRHAFIEPLEQATKLPQAPALKNTPLEIVHEISATVALLAISGGEFLWRGEPLDVAIPAMLEKVDRIDQTTQLFRSLGQPVVLDLIKKHDSAAHRRIDLFVKAALEAESFLLRCGVKRTNPKVEQAEIWKLAWAQPNDVNGLVEQLREKYACTTNDSLEKIFTNPAPTRGMTVLLAWTHRDPPSYGFKSHAIVKGERLATLAQKGQILAQLLFWHRLAKALSANPLLFGSRWPILAGSLTIVLLLAVHVPGPLGVALGLVPFSALALLRVGVNRWQARLVRLQTFSTKPWGWTDSIPRCRLEAKILTDKHGLPTTPAAIVSQLKQINADIIKLAKPDPYKLVPLPSRHLSAWLAAALSWGSLVLLTAGSIYRGIHHQPPSWAMHTSAWKEAFHKKAPEKPVAPEDIKLSWPYKLQVNSPFPPLELKVEGVFEPTGNQFKAATNRARGLLARYDRETIDALVAIYVPLEDDVGGILLFDGKKNAFLARNGVQIRFVPFPKQWLKIGDQFALFIEK